MPISQPRFDDRFMHVEACGHIETSDVEILYLQARQHAERCGSPIMITIDASRVEFITNGARIAFAEAVHTPLMRAILFAAPDTVIFQTIRTIQMLSDWDKVDVFPSMLAVRHQLAALYST